MTKTTVKTFKDTQEVYTNIHIVKEWYKNGNERYYVVADSAQFGKDSIMYEGAQYDECLEHVKSLLEGVYKVYELNHKRYHEETLATVYKWLGVETLDDCYSDENGRQTFIRVTNHKDFQALRGGYSVYHGVVIDYVSIEVVTDSQDLNYMKVLIQDTNGDALDSEPIYFLEWKPKKAIYNRLTKIKYKDLH